VVSDQVIVPVTVSMGQAEYPDDARERLRARFPKLVYVHALDTARHLGNTRVANTVLLGAVAHRLDLEKSSWLRALKTCVKPAFVELNLMAFEEGWKRAGAG
jgi:indolepyruvate ferredoxin oxidoreductase beta subunit